MRALPPIALALFAFAQCSGATVEEIAESTMPSVVKIVTYDDTGDEIGQGSGFFISPQRIITNEHVVAGAYSAEVFTNEWYYDQITILNADKDMDLAILRVDAEDEIPLQINPDAELKPGQRVIAIGHPLGLEKTVSDGLISSVQTIDGVQEVQITAPISDGSSGSPVLDQQGRVIGVVYAGIDEGQNLNFAIGIETLNEFLALEETPRQLKVAGSPVLWRVAANRIVVVKWIVTLTGVLIAIAFGGVSRVILIGIVVMAMLWRVLSWLWKSIYRLLTLSFRQCRYATASVSRQPWRLFCRNGSYVGMVLLIGAGWFLSTSVNSATEPTQSTVTQIESASSTNTQSITVYITRTGSKYHRNGCRYLNKSNIPITLNDAKPHYGPCSVCRPSR